MLQEKKIILISRENATFIVKQTKKAPCYDFGAKRIAKPLRIIFSTRKNNLLKRLCS